MFGTGGGDTHEHRPGDAPVRPAEEGRAWRRLRSAAAHAARRCSDGFLDFAIDQQPYLQGFYTVMEMFTFKVSGGLVGPADINTGLKFVTKDSGRPVPDHQDPLRRQRGRRRRSCRAPARSRLALAAEHGAARRRSGPRAACPGSPRVSCCGRRRASSSSRWCSSSISRSPTANFLHRRQPADAVAVRRRAGDHRLRRDHAADLPRDRPVGRPGLRARAVRDGKRRTMPACRSIARSSPALAVCALIGLVIGLITDRGSACRPSSPRSGCCSSSPASR